MPPKFPHIKFNSGAFGHTFVGRRAGRWLQEQLDGIGKPAVIFMIKNNRSPLEFLPAKMKIHYRNLAQEYRELFPRFTDEEVYNWIPDYWREIIESTDSGKQWGLRQVAIIRDFALT